MSVNESLPTIHWTENGAEHSALWRSEAGLPPPKRVVIADDQTPADTAFRLASEGTALLWRGDFQNARQLLQAMARRVDRKPQRKQRGHGKAPADITDAFHKHRLAQSQRARTLGMLLLPFEAGHVVPLRRAPDVHEACEQVYGKADTAYVASMRELLGLIGAFEWRKKGVEIPVLGERIHPWYGVFSPVRGEYIELVAKEALPSTALAFDIGIGTGVLAALLAQRGVKRVVGTDQDPRALGCARENIARLGLDSQVEIVEADMFPTGRAPLIVCNPPWVPARPSSPIEHAVFDPDSRMLRSFLNGLAAHLEPGGRGWLILSDFAEHLGLRSRDELLGWIDAAGLKVLGRADVRPRHPKSTDADDPLFAARKAEVTSLWRLATK